MNYESNKLKSHPFRRAASSGLHRLFPAARLTVIAILGFAPSLCLAQDVVELLNGAKVTGQMVEIRGSEKKFDFTAKVGDQTLTRTYDYSQVHAVTMKGKRHVLTPRPDGPPASSAPAGGGKNAEPAERTERTRAEVQAVIDSVGRTPPDWFDATPLDYPRSLDLSWPSVPKPVEKNWNKRKHIGHYVWDEINPNSNKWREGIRFLHHVVAVNEDNRGAQVKAMNQLGTLYASLLQDWPRAVFWWQQAGSGTSGGMGEGGFRVGYEVGLAKCYWELGNKRMAVKQLDKARGYSSSNSGALLLWATMGEHDKAIRIGEKIAKKWPERYITCGDVCRHGGRYDEAITFYEKAEKAGANSLKKTARERMDGLTAVRSLDLEKIRDGEYSDSSLGYSGKLTVSATVRDHRITSLEVTNHSEKQYYSALTDIPNKIIRKQSVKGIDTTTGATTTAEAIITATAKALTQGVQ